MTSFWNAIRPASVLHHSVRVYWGGSSDSTWIRMPRPANARSKIQRTRLAANTSVGTMMLEAPCCSVHSRRAAASSPVLLFAYPKVSIALSGTPSFSNTRRFASICPWAAPMTAARLMACQTKYANR